MRNLQEIFFWAPSKAFSFFPVSVGLLSWLVTSFTFTIEYIRYCAYLELVYLALRDSGALKTIDQSIYVFYSQHVGPSDI
jgi:hypothetical protein